MSLNLLQILKQKIEIIFRNKVYCNISNTNELTVEVHPNYIVELCFILKNNALFKFEQLSDICGMDYLTYGVDEWDKFGEQPNNFSRGLNLSKSKKKITKNKRFAVIYHLLSLSNNIRVCLKSFVNTKIPQIYSICNIWPVSNWFEREIFDLYGIEFVNHPDLRRILTDYSFEGFPCRKDFPVTGESELIYDNKKKRVVSRSVDIKNKEFMAKIINKDSRYE